MSLTITCIYKIGGQETLVTSKVSLGHKVKVGQIYHGRTGLVTISHVYESHSQGAYPGVASFNVSGDQSKQDFRVKDVLKIIGDNESNFSPTEPIVAELSDPITLIRHQRDQVLMDFYENLKAEDTKHADKWILETNYCAEHDDIWPNWEIACQLPSMVNQVFFQMNQLYSYPNREHYFENLANKLPFLHTVNFNFELLKDDQRQLSYDAVAGMVRIQYNFNADERELIWTQCGRPYIDDKYHPYLDRIWELYDHQLQVTIYGGSQFGFLRSPFSRYNNSVEDSYGDTHCTELEGHIIALQIDPHTLKPKIIDLIVLNPDDETLTAFLFPRGMALIACKDGK